MASPRSGRQKLDTSPFSRLPSVAHFVGSRHRPRANPGLRGLALGYTLPPTAWAEMSKPHTTNCVGGIAPEYSCSSTLSALSKDRADLPLSWRLLEEVFSQRRENINQHNLFIKHSGAMPAPRRKMQHVARLRHSLLIADDETHTASLDYGELFVWMLVSRRFHVWLEPQPANHKLVPDDHLPFDAYADTLSGYALPVAVLGSAGQS